MDKLLNFKINKEEIIQDEKFRFLCKKYNILHLTWQDFIRRHHLENNLVFFRLNDFPVNEKIFRKHFKKDSKWFAMNCEKIHPNIISIPLGITDTSWCSLIGDLDIIEEFNKTERNYKNLAYINFNTDRKDQGLPDRLTIKKLFSNEEWITDGKFQRDKDGHRRFIDNIYNHKFVFCPRGNGVDTHRLWMSLYLGTIPIVKDHITYKDFKHLPILFINEWSEINKEFLDNKFEEIHSKKYNMNILRMSYWEKYIKENTK